MFQEDLAPIVLRKNIPFIYFKEKKKSFPCVSKGTMQLCPCSFSHCAGLRRSQNIGPVQFPLSSPHCHLWGPEGDVSSQGRFWPEREGGKKRATQIWSSMGKTNRVPRLNSSWSRESSSRSRASSEVLPILLLFAFRPDPAAVLPDAPLAARAASPNVKVRSLSLQRQSESWSFSCSWFWKWQGQRRWGDPLFLLWHNHKSLKAPNLHSWNIIDSCKAITRCSALIG